MTYSTNMKSKCSPIVKVFLVFLIITTCQCQEVDERCEIKATGESGTCKLSFNCPRAEEQAKKGIAPTLCGFYQLTTPVVCCENTITPEPNDNSFLNNDEFIFPEDPPSRNQGNSGSNHNSRKSEQKCNEYSKYITGVVEVIPLVTHTEAISINVTKCWDNSSPLIVGGMPAYKGEFPFMALIGFISEDGDLNWRCGGTIVSDRWIVTAAHCTYSRDEGEPRKIRLGELDYTKEDPDRVDYDVDRIISHPQYKYPEKYNDVALISTNRKIRFTRYIRPACLYTKPSIEQSVAIATGWGRTDYVGENSNKLMKVSLNIYPVSECNRVFKSDKTQLPRGILRSMLCVGELKGGKDTCLGDSGGPLVITDKQNWCKFYIIGVTSFGKLCAQANTPAVYTKISEYVSWIEQTIW